MQLGALAPRRDFFDVRDMVRAYLLAAEKGRKGEVYNVATGRPVPIRRVLELLLGRAKIPLRVRAKEGRSDVLSGDASKFRSATGWRPLIPLAQTLSDLLSYERARSTGLNP
jgi:GDP-4-dehydro-6-deoxy-D-mannose reductase